MGLRKNLLIHVARKEYAGQAFEPKQIKGTVAKTSRVFEIIYEHADDPDLDQSPLPSYWAQPDGWPTFLNACQIFDDRAMVAATGHATTGESVEDESTFRNPEARRERNTLPAFQAVWNSCNRDSKVQRRHKVLSDWWHGDAEVWYAAPGTPDKALIDGLVIKRLFPVEKQRTYHVSDLVKAKVLRPVEVRGADTAYLFDYTEGKNHVGWVLASTGPYVVLMRATRPSVKSAFGMAPTSPERLSAGAAAMIENIKAATD